MTVKNMFSKESECSYCNKELIADNDVWTWVWIRILSLDGSMMQVYFHIDCWEEASGERYDENREIIFKEKEWLEYAGEGYRLPDAR